MADYVAVLLAALLGVGILLPLVLLPKLVGPRALRSGERGDYDRVKESPYECGVPPTGDARRRFSVKFFLVALLFVIFDLEGVLIYPWAVTFQKLGVVGFVEMLIFIGVLALGLAYVWRKGALEW
ncbi:MAG: NADH-quinone oxidoreductase subunit A [Deltaproteobacteria bacterium]|nr:NADH-quinone oxidoreductase subunit A [Deltaproteobacteria bacterium]